MPWLTFEQDYLWRPAALRGHVAIQFKRGNVIFATREAAESALTRKAARESSEAEVEHARRRPA